jgi:hypothetical protein
VWDFDELEVSRDARRWSGARRGLFSFIELTLIENLYNLKELVQVVYVLRLSLRRLNLLCGVLKLGFFWRLNRHDTVFFQFSREIRITQLARILKKVLKNTILFTINYTKKNIWWFQWYRLQNSRTVRDLGLKFDMGIVFERLEDIMPCFLPGSVHNNVTSVNSWY